MMMEGDGLLSARGIAHGAESVPTSSSTIGHSLSEVQAKPASHSCTPPTCTTSQPCTFPAEAEHVGSVKTRLLSTGAAGNATQGMSQWVLRRGPPATPASPIQAYTPSTLQPGTAAFHAGAEPVGSIGRRLSCVPSTTFPAEAEHVGSVKTRLLSTGAAGNATQGMSQWVLRRGPPATPASPIQAYTPSTLQPGTAAFHAGAEPVGSIVPGTLASTSAVFSGASATSSPAQAVAQKCAKKGLFLAALVLLVTAGVVQSIYYKLGRLAQIIPRLGVVATACAVSVAVAFAIQHRRHNPGPKHHHHERHRDGADDEKPWSWPRMLASIFTIDGNVDARIYFADLARRTQFDPNVHGKYQANEYFQPNSMAPMLKAERSSSSARAFQHFTAGLAAIQQSEPISHLHSGKGSQRARATKQARWQGMKQAHERALQERGNQLSALRFRKRLLLRHEAWNKGQYTLFVPGSVGAPIREGTKDLLLQAPEKDFDPLIALSLGISILSYAYVIYTHVCQIYSFDKLHQSFTTGFQSSAAATGFAGSVSPQALVIIAFWGKELFFLTAPLMMFILSLLAGVAIALAVPWSYTYHIYVRLATRDGGAHVRAARRCLSDTILPAFKETARLCVHVCVSFSTLWRMMVLAKQLASSKCNASFKDFDHSITALSNILFSLVLVYAQGLQSSAHQVFWVNNTVVGCSRSTPERTHESISLLMGACVSGVSLFLKLVMHRRSLNKLEHALKDVNENRLSKFELALLMTKLIDVCTVEDVQYNFTEHFYRHPKESDELMQAGLASEAEVFAIPSLLRSFLVLHSNAAPLTR